MKMLIVAPSRSSFIEKDHQILNELASADLKVVWSLKEIFRTCFLVLKYDTCLFWFASIRFLPIFIIAKLFGKKTYTVAGGYDVSLIPELDYGGLNRGGPSPLLRKFLLHHTDKVITVSDSNTWEAKTNAEVPVTKTSRIYLGFDLPNVELKPWSERKDQVIFIACCDSTSYKIKGFQTFLELARALPHISFIHIGKVSVPEFTEAAGKLSNVKLLGYVKNLSYEFSDLLNDSKVIFLPSKIESFGASVVEGALHGCIPVVSKNYALPEVAGEKGKVCEDFTSFENALKEIMNEQNIDVNELQQYYFERFSTDKRLEAFKKLLA